MDCNFSIDVEPYLLEDSSIFYFFEHEDLRENSNWLELLVIVGRFDRAPDSIYDDKNKTIFCPIWPESQYLAKMASRAPDIVTKIILEVVPDTNNYNVHFDFISSALALPPENKRELRSIAKKESGWIKGQGYFGSFLVYKYQELLDKLIKFEDFETALELADTLLEVLPDPKKDEKLKNEDKLIYLTPQARFDSFHYAEIIRIAFPDLTKNIGIEIINILCSKLTKFIELSETNDDGNFYKEFTYHWRPAIEDHAQNSNYADLGDVLVDAVRDMSIFLIDYDSTKFQEIVSYLEDKKSQIFDRIVLFLLNKYPDLLPNRAIEAITNISLFDDIAFLHEYARLLDNQFDKLSPKTQKTIFSWIDNPDIDELRDIFKSLMGREPDEKELIKQKERWQLKKLALIENHLKGKRKSEYEKLVEKYTKPEHPDFAVYTSIGSFGPNSPIPTEELEKMTIDEMVEKINNWNWPGDFGGPSPEGLSRVLSNVVKSKPEQFVEETEKLKNLEDPTCIKGIIIGLRDALKEDRTFEWPKLLNFCLWVTSQPREMEIPDRGSFDKDPDWSRSRRWIASLLDDGFDSKTNPIPIELRNMVWGLLKLLAEDPSPYKEEEKNYDESEIMDFMTLSINTTRGVAMHAVVRFALWLRRDFEKRSNSESLLANGFSEMSGVKEVLEKHLDIQHDPSYTIRSVYGQWFPWLVLLDEAWAKENALKIFPDDEKDRKYLHAAWGAYIKYSRPYNNIFVILKKQYSDAVDILPTQETKDGSSTIYRDRLAEHLVTYYWRGLFDLEDSLFKNFWEKADNSLREHTIDFLGRNLSNTPEDIESDILDRFKNLWTFRLSVVNNAEKKESFISEMSCFGWWFTSKKFEDAWVLPKLYESLKISRKVEFNRDVVKKLAEISDEFPVDTFLCLNEIARGEVNLWDIKSWYKEAYIILENALNCKNKEIVQDAIDLTNYLGSLGFIEEFRKLVA